nr:TPA_inf: conotoxin precursor Virro03 [Conus ebraeus]
MMNLVPMTIVLLLLAQCQLFTATSIAERKTAQDNTDRNLITALNAREDKRKCKGEGQGCFHTAECCDNLYCRQSFKSICAKKPYWMERK